MKFFGQSPFEFLLLDMFKKILAGTVIAIVFLGLGIFIGTKFSKKAVPQCATPKIGDTYRAGWDAAKERVQAYFGTTLIDTIEVKNVYGTIQKIDDNKLKVKIHPVEPLADPDLDIRIITVDANTKVSLAVQKDQAQYQKEFQDFQNKMKQSPTQTNYLQQPAPFDSKAIALSDLKENQQITVTASENIKDKKEFTATQIDAQEIAASVAAPAPVSTPVNLPVPPVSK